VAEAYEVRRESACEPSIDAKRPLALHRPSANGRLNWGWAKVLSDPEARKKYDAYGKEGLKGVACHMREYIPRWSTRMRPLIGRAEASAAAGGGAGGGFDFNFRDSHDIFKDFFGAPPTSTLLFAIPPEV
jgi:hypothetical protein